MSRTTKKPKLKKIRDLHALNAAQRKAGPEKNKKDKRKTNKKTKLVDECILSPKEESDALSLTLDNNIDTIFD